MTDEELGREVVKAFRNAVARDNADYKAAGARARALLAKPVATREAVQDFWRERFDLLLGNNDASRVVAAISRLAPPARPRMMIEGMSAEQIEREFRCSMDIGPRAIHAAVDGCARVAHRLANTPAPEVDPDEEAKAICWKYQQASGMKRHETSEDAWAHQSLESRNGWRAVAASKKEAGGE